MNRDLEAYAILKRALLERDKRCRHCRVTQNLTPHHVIFRSKGGKDALNNLIILCASCHTAHHANKLKIEVLNTLENDLEIKFTRVKGWKPT